MRADERLREAIIGDGEHAHVYGLFSALELTKDGVNARVARAPPHLGESVSRGFATRGPEFVKLLLEVGGMTFGIVGATSMACRCALGVLDAALELGQHNIRVNSIHPGGVNTPMGNPMGDDSMVNMAFTHQALPRIGAPSEIAAAALFLASDDASYITGAELAVDGGWMAGRIVPELPGSGLSIAGVGYNA